MPQNPRRAFQALEVMGTLLDFVALKTNGWKVSITFSNRKLGNLLKCSLMEKWRQMGEMGGSVG